MTTITIRRASPADLDACHRIEARCFPPGEAAPRASIQTRIVQFPAGFLVAEYETDRGREIVGMINGGATHRADITDEDFKKLIGHDPNGANLVIFSLAVLPDYRRQGIAARLLRTFIAQAQKRGHQRILLLCKTPLIAYYERFGFVHAGESASTHGGAAWHEMALLLEPDAHET
jgi:ribosomal protein S18 acetylase RimI-like enzyme